MDPEKAMVPVNQGGALDVPEEGQLRAKLAAIGRFQAMVRATLRDGHDYGVIPGTGSKATLLKPGAEKILKLLDLADEYTILDKVEDWENGFFRYIVKCQARHVGTGIVVSEGLGECNSREARYAYRWAFGSQVPDNVDKSRLVTREITTKHGRTKQYRIENEDIYSLVNTILKMSKKRSSVDVALSVGRLSDIFTQDLDDIRSQPEAPPDEPAPEAPHAAPAPPAQTPAPAKQATPAQGLDETDTLFPRPAVNPEGRWLEFNHGRRTLGRDPAKADAGLTKMLTDWGYPVVTLDTPPAGITEQHMAHLEAMLAKAQAAK